MTIKNLVVGAVSVCLGPVTNNKQAPVSCIDGTSRERSSMTPHAKPPCICDVFTRLSPSLFGFSLPLCHTLIYLEKKNIQPSAVSIGFNS